MQRHSYIAKNYALIGFAIFIAILFLHRYTSIHHISPSHQAVGAASFKHFQMRERPVVIYHPPDSNPGIPSGFTVFHKNGCPIRNCVLTKSELHKHTADVILFGENSEWKPPQKRSKSQVWIIRLMESPENTKFLRNYMAQINYTASYHRDSDIYLPYGLYKPFQKVKKKRFVNYAKGKSGLAVWLVSNCLTNNNRMLFAKRLSEFMQVDIYGECGKGSVPRKDLHRLIKNYKFYLAFENSNCRQYISEKFWINALSNNAVPIVMGAPKSDYMAVAPPHSFIHVDDYEPPQLAQYLLYLDKNDTAYNEYFAWKSFGRVVSSDFYCQLCSFVQSPPRKIYNDIDTWWKNTGKCQNVP
ncbi:unnamed protein product [Cylicocyclus nassatus]|uniref:Fucosyltransferase n=1 Tax=Cylicocyclus nassatus TaxID=53992 RepID=A0AA36MH61_CYLNA|nr:unnamed protein product [Cylicocyclus nassatus]